MVELSHEEYLLFKNLVFKNFGINLVESKKTLIVGRLQSMVKKYSLDTFADYYQMLVNDKEGKYLSELINKISTNYTFFYRENVHFDFLVDTVVPDAMKKLKDSNSKDIRLWCAGCASGEEPYTIIMMLLESLKTQYANWNMGILATDISINALDFARQGLYPADRITKLPVVYKNHYLTKVKDDQFQVSDKVKNEVTYRRFNLMNKSWPFKKQFNVILCRNVMIYFNAETRRELVTKFINSLLPGGYLFIGHSETIDKTIPGLKYIMPAVYQKVDVDG